MMFLLLASLVSAEVCEVDRIKQVLKKILFLYYTEPDSVPLTKEEVKDMLVFYLSINDQNITVDCSAFGSRSNRPISDVVNAGDNVADKIPACTDGTKYGECSKARPAYCYAGAISSKCDLCGCPTNSVCGKSGKCDAAGQNITCSKDIDCGQISFTGSYYCINNNIVKNILNYSCLDAGTMNSRCAATNGTVWLSYCNPNLNQSCVIGQNYCKVAVANTSTTTVINQSANQTNQTFSGILTIKGRLIDYFTKQPIANGLIFTWDGETRRDTYTNSNGEFSTNADTAQAMVASPKSYGIEPKCYDNVGMGLFRNSDNTLYVSVTINSITGASKTIPVSGSEVNFDDITMWPAVDIQIDSDTAVKFNLEYSSSTGAGNSMYKLYHYLSYSFPLTVDTRVKLTDQSGNNYYSPYLSLPLSNGCQKVGLTFFNNQFSWNSSVTQVNTTSNCFVKIDGVVVKSVYATDRNDCYSKTSFGSINCATYASYFTNGAHFLEQYFGATDRVNNEYCTCINGVCVQGNQTNQTTTNQTAANQTTAMPDLIVSDMVFVPSSPTASDNVKALLTVKNVGTATAGNSVAAVTFRSQYLYTVTKGVNSLAPSSTQTLDMSTVYGWNGSFSAGTYIFNATADIFNAVSESNENNNILTKSLTVLSAATNQTGLKGLAAGCTSGVQCSSGYCVSMPLDNNIGNCTYYGGDRSVNYTTCAQGYYPTLPCQCGGVAIHAGACNNGIFYWPPTQSGNNVYAYCTDGNTQCKTGICFFNVCSYAVKCGPQSPGYCANHEECLAYGASC